MGRQTSWCGLIFFKTSFTLICIQRPVGSSIPPLRRFDLCHATNLVKPECCPGAAPTRRTSRTYTTYARRNRNYYMEPTSNRSRNSPRCQWIERGWRMERPDWRRFFRCLIVQNSIPWSYRFLATYQHNIMTIMLKWESTLYNQHWQPCQNEETRRDWYQLASLASSNNQGNAQRAKQQRMPFTEHEY